MSLPAVDVLGYPTKIFIKFLKSRYKTLFCVKSEAILADLFLQLEKKSVMEKESP